jgi:hypothetical protein
MFFESLKCSCDTCNAGMTMDLSVFVPTKSNLTFVVNKKELIKKIQGMKVSTIIFHSEDNKDLFVSETSDILEYEKKKISLNTKPVVKKQTYFHLGLGKKYLLDALKGMGDEATFHYGNRNAPVLIISGNRKAVLMPVNIG